MRELLRRIQYLWNRRRLEEEMACEMAHHREQMKAGGRTNFGSELRLREDAREVWGWTWLDRCRQDLTYGARMLRGSPGFTLTAMLVLALGIGVPLTAFRAVLSDLRGAPVPDPDSLVRLVRRAPGALMTTMPFPEFAFYRMTAQSFREVIGISERNPAVFGLPAGGSNPEQINIAFATPNYFPEFGITAARGRLLNSGDDDPATEPAALVGELFWQRRLGGDPAAIGQNIRVNGKLLRVVGVVPRAAKIAPDIWMPLAREPYVMAGSTRLTDWDSALDGYGRLKPGVSAKVATEETTALAARLREVHPTQVWKGEYLEARPVQQIDADSQEFQILVTAAALVVMLLIAACANLGTLVLARGVVREREIRTRMALGAGRARVVRQLFTESLLLAGISGVCGLVLSSAVLKIIQLQHNPDASLIPDWRVVAATTGMALIAALVFGLPPALRLTTLVPGGGRARTIFLGAQVAASCLLLVVSSLLVTSLNRLGVAKPGFDYSHLIWISPGLKAHGYSGPAAQGYLNALEARVGEMQEVKVSQVWLAPWGNTHMGSSWEGRQFGGNHVDAQFLDTMGMHLMRGRNFRPGDTGVTLISEATERVLWPNRDALGKALPWDVHGPTVIGVVRDASTTAVGETAPLEFYLPKSSGDSGESVLLVHVAGSPRNYARRLQDAARSLDGRLQPVVEVLTDSYDREVQKVSNALAVITILGAVAILLSGIGLAGLAGYTVAQRTREIGLRIALGARAGQIVRVILAPMGRPIFIGYVCGAAGGFAVSRVLRGGIPAMAGMNLFDPVAYLMAMLFFAGVLGVAIFAPGRRAVRMNPGKALQHE